MFPRLVLGTIICFSSCATVKTTHELAESTSENSIEDKNDSNLTYGQRLTADRKVFEDLRFQIPQEKKIVNDEEAFMAGLFLDTKEKESRIRDKFDRYVRQKREFNRKEQDHLRKNFDHEQKIRRDDFQKKQIQNRNLMLKNAKTAEERRRVYSEQESERLEFNKDLKDQRDQFEDSQRQRSKEFDSYIREKTSDFNQRLRSFRENQSSKGPPISP